MLSDYNIEPISVERDGETLRGKLYMPEGDGPFPCIIISHGFYGSQYDWKNLAEAAAKQEMAAIIFDFMGGSLESESDGLVFEMSVKTEVEDLKLIIEKAKELPKISHLFLVGADQGGFVSALAAKECRDDIYAMVLYYPSFNIPDRVRKLFRSRKDFPTASRLKGNPVGEVYYSDVYNMRFRKEITGFYRPVLIIHGSNDEEVPIRYSKDAIVQYPHGQIVELEETGHEFTEDNLKNVIPITLKFIEIVNTFEDLLEEHKKYRKIED